jgi:hypothetical protein
VRTDIYGPNTRDWLAGGAIITEGVCERSALVVVRGEPPIALVRAALPGEVLEREIGALIPDLARRVHGEVAFMGLVGRMVSFLARVPKEP